MMKLKVFCNINQAIELCTQLGSLLEPDMAKAMNRAARGIKTDQVRLLSQKGIARSDVNDSRMWAFRSARPGGMEALTVIKGQRLGLEKFNPGPSQRMQGKTRFKNGVAVNLLGKVVRFRHAFVNDIYSPELVVWQRKRGATPKVKKYEKAGVVKHMKGRFPVSKLTFVSVPQMADDDDVLEIVVKNAEERYLKQLDHLVDRMVKDF